MHVSYYKHTLPQPQLQFAFIIKRYVGIFHTIAIVAFIQFFPTCAVCSGFRNFSLVNISLVCEIHRNFLACEVENFNATQNGQ